ncbi:MAG: 3-oxoacyl-[acyl-carrier-protein] reductase [Acidobacteria bacterium]|nr:3-oxoacyl-[acyl-carrier-protein] reductase [Acidobacteriota bacterium]
MSLAGKTALVTGASRGIGKSTAIALARQGAEVYCVSTTQGGCDESVRLCREAGGDAHGLAADISDEEAVKALASSVLSRSGNLDILVNNAGITRDGLFLRMDTGDFDAVMRVNLRGPFLLCRAFARAMARAKGGRIINITSVVGLSGNAGQANYAASKAGLVGLSKSLARELAGRGVTVNLVAPGFITTDMTEEIPSAMKEAALKGIPLGRFGSAEDVAGAVVFLAGEPASYITGQVLVVDGGMTM